MRIGGDEDASRRPDVQAWAAQIAAMHVSVARMTASAPSAPSSQVSGVAGVGAAAPVGSVGGVGRSPQGAAEDSWVVGAAEGIRAQVLGARQGHMTIQDGLGYVQVAREDLDRSQEVLRRMRAVAVQAVVGGDAPAVAEVLQKYVDRSAQELEGIAEQARHHTLQMLGATARMWMADAAAARVIPRPGGAAVPSLAVPPLGVFASGVVAGQGSASEAAPVGAAAVAPSSSASVVSAVAVPATDRPSAASGTVNRVPIGSPEQARRAVARIDSAADVLAAVRGAVDEAEQSLSATIEELGVGQVDLGAARQGAVRASEPDGGLSPAQRQLRLQEATETGAAVLVEATRAQFAAVTSVLGGAAAAGAAAVVAQGAVAARDVTVGARPVVEPVAVSGRSARASSGREGASPSGAGVARR
ncbi:hypothetical protein KEM60_00839 [Austwickia sp. TVS 96-490-7B]|uniref:flagellin N-terminal helical domain-containing protein n=1 Tax=Austwickia sp. TVS 96-490-7B TaxID=2830843 RepID=UPI001C57E70F|nr:hypothetical protein [Austwickia sp. TVS 96-490-7B]MBW3084650.1 hypothetical protein [Austwickia sp. TVS 96-490-7B]